MIKSIKRETSYMYYVEYRIKNVEYEWLWTPVNEDGFDGYEHALYWITQHPTDDHDYRILKVTKQTDYLKIDTSDKEE